MSGTRDGVRVICVTGAARAMVGARCVICNTPSNATTKWERGERYKMVRKLAERFRQVSQEQKHQEHAGICENTIGNKACQQHTLHRTNYQQPPTAPAARAFCSPSSLLRRDTAEKDLHKNLGEAFLIQPLARASNSTVFDFNPIS
jgi:hypothetical protein